MAGQPGPLTLDSHITELTRLKQEIEICRHFLRTNLTTWLGFKLKNMVRFIAHTTILPELVQTAEHPFHLL